jgi:hypothetical protein
LSAKDTATPTKQSARVNRRVLAFMSFSVHVNI